LIPIWKVFLKIRPSRFLVILKIMSQELSLIIVYPGNMKRIMLSRNYVSQIIKWHLDTIYVSKKIYVSRKIFKFSKKKKKFFYMFFTYLFFFFYKIFFLKNFIFYFFFVVITSNIAFVTCKQLVKKKINFFNFRLIFKKNYQVLIINM
jgi:hypothetical protein